MPPRRRCPPNKLHDAAARGNERMVLTQLAKGLHPDQGTPNGCTALIIAAGEGHLRVVRTLVEKGADVSLPADGGGTALHAASQQGHLAVAIELLKAVANLEQKDSHGKTPLHAAADAGQWGVMRVLIDSGSNVNTRALDGSTPLFAVAFKGYMDGIKVLLRAKADPLLGRRHPTSGMTAVPLDAAAHNGHVEAVRELVQSRGIEGCAGAGRGAQALKLAAEINSVDVMRVLTDAGAVDTGMALVVAAEFCHEACVKMLLIHHAESKTHRGSAGYVNHRGKTGRTPLFNAIVFRRPSPRIVRLLIDAGADTASAVGVLDTRGTLIDHTPLALTAGLLSGDEEMEGKDKNASTEERRRRLEAIFRLLLRVDAVHALSWMWADSAAPIDVARAAEDGDRDGDGASGKKTKMPSVPLVSVLPLLRRRARRTGVVLVPLFRYVRKRR